MAVRHLTLGRVWRSPLALVTWMTLLVAGLIVGPATSAHAVANRYAIGDDIGRVVDVANWATYDGAPVHMWSLRSTGNVLNQRWDFVARDSSYFEFVNANAPGKCLDENAGRNGAVVYIYHCTHANNQQWRFENYSGSAWRLRNRHDGRCLDIKDFNKANGAALQVWDCSGGWNQRFHAIETG